MKQSGLAEFFGLTGKQLRILLGVVGLLLCGIALYPAYMLLPFRSALFPASSPTPTFRQLSINTPVPYVPAPSLTGWPSGTPATMLPSATPSPIPSRTPRPTITRTPTITPTGTATPTVTATPTSTPTATPVPVGTFLNPVPLGSSFALPGIGSLAVLQAAWSPDQAGLLIVKLSFTCDRPAGRGCDTTDLNIHVADPSGQLFSPKFSWSVPEPPFGRSASVLLERGQKEEGYLGFSPAGSEGTLRLSARVFLQEGEFFFWLPPAPAQE